MAITVLVVDDDQDLLLLLTQWLKMMGHEVITAFDGEMALAAMEKEKFDLVMLDLDIPKIRGIEVLKRAQQCCKDLPIIVITASGTIPLAIEAMKLGAADF